MLRLYDCLLKDLHDEAEYDKLSAREVQTQIECHNYVGP